MKKNRNLFFLVSDALLINCGIIFAFLLRFDGRLPERNFVPYRLFWYALTFIYIGCFYLFGLYEQRHQKPGTIFLSVLKAMNTATLFGVGLTYVYRYKFGAFPTSVFALSWIINILLITLSRLLFLKNELVPKRVLIIGSGEKGGDVVTNLQKEKSEYDVVAIIKEANADLPQVIKNKNIEEVIIASGREMSEEVLGIIQKCRGTGVKFKLVPDLYEIFLNNVNSEDMDGLPLVGLETEPISGFYWDIKRATDIILSLFGIMFFSPLFLMIPVIIKQDSLGPVFIRQERVGKDGKTFVLSKFRSMHENAEKNTGPVFAGKSDPRTTPIGRFLRKTHIDELPQLLNILKGEMSLVGPRPERPLFVEQFIKEVPGYAQRLNVRPGLTGLAQVHAAYDVSVRNKIRYDLLYIKNYSPLLDIEILLKTVQIVWRKKKGRV